MNFTPQEIADLLKAISTAQDELCVDHTGVGRFPEGTAYYDRLELLADRIRNNVHDR